LATCRTRCKACDSASIVRAGRTVPERILGSVGPCRGKKELVAPCCDRICSRQRSRVAEQLKGALWLRLRRQAHTRLAGADDGMPTCAFFASVMCPCTVPCQTYIHTHVRRAITGNMLLLGSNRGAALLHRASTCEACSPFCSRPRRSESQQSAHGSLITLYDWVHAAVPAILQYFRKRNMSRELGGRASRLRDIYGHVSSNPWV